ncbi:hypothetical protein Tco_0517200, partial [Tanacetum coccineum]
TIADDEHAPAMAPPVRTDEQILPRIRWVPIGKSNCYLNEEKSQPSPIFKIAVDILKQTNFFRAFTASSTIPAIYIQQFWDTICFYSKARSYKCQLDEQWFDLTQDTLRDALHITPVNKNRAFSPPTPDTLVEFVNKLGYPKKSYTCLMSPLIGLDDEPQCDQILWGVVNRAHFEYAERMVGRIYSILPLLHRRQMEVGTTYYREVECNSFHLSKYQVSQVIIFSPQRLHNFHPRPDSPLHLPTEEPVLGKVVKKRTVKSSKQLVDEFVDEGVPAAKPSLEDTEEAILQKKCQEGERESRRGYSGPSFSTFKLRKEESSAEQYIFQRRSHIPTETAGREDSTSLYAELGLYGSDTESDEEMPSVVCSGNQDVAWLVSALVLRVEGQVGPKPDAVAESLPSQSLGVLDGPNLINSGSNGDDQVIPEGTLSAIQENCFSYTSRKDTELNHVSVTIQQDTSIHPPMESRSCDQPDSPIIHWLTYHHKPHAAPTTTNNNFPLPTQPQQGSSDSILISAWGELGTILCKLVEENQGPRDRLDKQGIRIT